MTQPAGSPQPPAAVPGGQWTEQTQVGPAPGLVFGGFWIRVVAYIIDFIPLAIVGAILRSVSPVLGLVILLYMPLCWGLLGQTFGMMPFGLRVVRSDDGGKLTWSNVILRYIGLYVAFIVVFIGIIWVALDSRKRGWHDMIGGTVVVRKVG
jgi:uncharacterized RDD family membrane protein YckC